MSREIPQSFILYKNFALSKIWMSSSVLYNKANIKRKVKNGSVLSMYCFNNIFIHSAHS